MTLRQYTAVFVFKNFFGNGIKIHTHQLFVIFILLAKAIGIDSGVVAKAIRLTWLSPKIIHKIIIGEVDISMQTLRRSFPIVWRKQEKELL